MAFEVSEFVAVKIAVFLAVAEFDFSAALAEEALWIHVLTDCAIIVILAAIVNFVAFIAVVESHLLSHEFQRGSLLFFCGLAGQAILFVDSKSCLCSLNLIQQSHLHQLD